MPTNKVLEQHVAVFGESGSGKTVLVSSFYGWEQEPNNVKRGAFNLVAENAGQGNQLHQSYLGMKNSAQVPDPTRFSATSYSFRLRILGKSESKPLQAKPFDAVRLVWHDYPGEWFEDEVSGPEEASRRITTFRQLLGSHVALLLVDGQKLLDNAGEEERYLKSLVASFRNSLLLLEDDLLEDGRPLARFPRIWFVALSKADLLPDLDVQSFKELIIQKIAAELEGLRSVLARFVESSDALSVGEDFLLLSSARFTPNAIEVSERVGVDLVLPITSIVPFERHLRWLKAHKLSTKVARLLTGNAEVVAAAFGVASGLAAALLRKKGRLAGAVGLALNHLKPTLDNAIESAGQKLDAADAAATTKRENLAEILLEFNTALDEAEEQQVMSRSQA